MIEDDTDSDAEAEYSEILGTEVFVDVARLRVSVSLIHMLISQELARDGIPQKYRGEAWKYLLGVAKPDKCLLCFLYTLIVLAEELTIERAMQERYAELEKTNCAELNHVRGEISRCVFVILTFSPHSV